MTTAIVSPIRSHVELHGPTPLASFRTTKQAQSWTIGAQAGAVFVFRWGDGTITRTVATGGNQSIVHTYASPGAYSIGFYIAPKQLTYFDCGDNALSGTLPSFGACTALTNFYCYSNSFSGTLPSFAACTALAAFACYSSSFSGTLPSFAACTALATFNCYNNAFSGTLPSFAACTGLTSFYCHSNSFSGTLPSFGACTALTNFVCVTNSFSAYTAGAIALTCTQWYASANAFTSTTDIDAMLADMAANIASRPANGTMVISGGTNAAPSNPAGLASRAAIQARPWTCTTN